MKVEKGRMAPKILVKRAPNSHAEGSQRRWYYAAVLGCMRVQRYVRARSKSRIKLKRFDMDTVVSLVTSRTVHAATGHVTYQRYAGASAGPVLRLGLRGDGG